MFTLVSNFHVFASSSHKKDRKRFRKFGKKVAQERRTDFERMAEKIKDIAEDEKRRTKEFVKEHREFFEKQPDTTIDFFEKK